MMLLGSARTQRPPAGQLGSGSPGCAPCSRGDSCRVLRGPGSLAKRGLGIGFVLMGFVFNKIKQRLARPACILNTGCRPVALNYRKGMFLLQEAAFLEWEGHQGAGRPTLRPRGLPLKEGWCP